MQTVVAVASGAVFAFATLKIYDLLSAYPPVVPLSVPVLLGVLAIAGFVYGARLPTRLEERRISAKEAFIAVVAGKSMVVTGAVMAGAHTVYVMRYLGQIEAATPLQRVLHGAGVIVASVLLAAAGWLIEKRLQLKDPPARDEERGVEGAPT